MQSEMCLIAGQIIVCCISEVSFQAHEIHLPGLNKLQKEIMSVYSWIKVCIWFLVSEDGSLKNINDINEMFPWHKRLSFL